MRAVYWKELADFFAARRFVVLLLLIALAGVWAAYNASQVILDEAGQAPTDFVFLRLFTTSRGDSAITFIFFLGIFGPLLGLSLGFNAINEERARGTLTRLLSQPIHRDALINGKFFAAITVLGITILCLILVIIGVGLYTLGFAPGTDEMARIALFFVATLIYVSVWLALSILFSLAFDRAVVSAMAGLVPQVRTVVSNAVSLHPQVVSPGSVIKLNVAVPLVSLITPYLDCSWGLEAPTLRAKLITAMVKATHRECDNTVCRLTSFTYGFGFPALWSHENLSEQTHEWLQYEFAAVPMTFFKQIAKCARAGHLVSVKGYPELPKSFVDVDPPAHTRFAFFAGKDNKVFVPESQVTTHAWFEERDPGRHTLHLVDGYGHLDMFMGSNSARDVFPAMIDELAH